MALISSGFLHTYVSYLDEPCTACLLLLSVDSEQFSVLSECKKKIVEVSTVRLCVELLVYYDDSTLLFPFRG